GGGMVAAALTDGGCAPERPHWLLGEVGGAARWLGGDDHPPANDRVLPELGHATAHPRAAAAARGAKPARPSAPCPRRARRRPPRRWACSRRGGARARAPR